MRRGPARAGARSRRRNTRGLVQAGRLLSLAALGALVLGTAQARTVRIVSAATLELRNQDDQELVIISGTPEAPAELRIDDDVVRAARVEFNRTRRTLVLVGAATYRTAKDGQNLQGENLVVDLGSEALTGRDVLISDSQLEIRGAEVERVPGQLRARSGYFTPCARCGRTPNDYAFRAERLLVYPGDRLVAYRAQLLLADVPVLYLPVVVLPLNDQARQPQLVVGSGAPDGVSVEADLPFSIGSSVLGTTLLRYYQNRSPSLGGGVDLRAYAPLDWVDRLDLYALALPAPFAADGAAQSGYDVNLNFSVKGRLPLALATGTGSSGGLDYSLAVTRSDIGRALTDPDRDVTTVNFGARVVYPRFTAAITYLDRLGDEPTTAVSTPYRRKEVVLDPLPFMVGDVNVDIRLTGGTYTAGSNALSPSASAAGLNFTTTRLEEAHEISLTRALGADTELRLTNSFVGRYYGTGGRTVQLNLAGSLTRRWAGGNTFSVKQEYTRLEGTSPFTFDAVPQRLTAPLTVNLSTVPTRGSTFGVTYVRDAFAQTDLTGAAVRNETLNVTAGVTRKPVNASYALDYNFTTGDLTSLSYNFTVGDPDASRLTLVPATPAVPATPTTPAVPGRPAYYARSSAWPFPRLTLSASGGYQVTTGVQPVTLAATVASEVRTNAFTLTGVYDVREPGEELTSLSARYSAATTRDTVLNPLSVSGNETLALASPRVYGSHSLTWRGYTVSTAHDLTLERADTATDSGRVTFSVGSVAGAADNWQLTYGGPYDLRRLGFSRPQLVGSLNLTRPGQRLSAAASLNLPGLDQSRTEFAQGSLNAAWQRGRFSLSGTATYLRSRTGEDVATDTLTFTPLRAGVALGDARRPGAYLTASLEQTLTYVGGVRQGDARLAPVVGLTIDRCCWVLQAEADLTQGRYRLAVGLPGQSYPLFNLDATGTQVPLLSP
ncbi:hypothetical protein [Deinococcus petrolearius]|uniref:LPS-assembly protein LptD n=1 Tax=Deinococcus petrolearius TaxID=1751295 RepID=A0ABW1DKA2_9DEIO